jgi:hypothetical protein
VFLAAFVGDRYLHTSITGLLLALGWIALIALCNERWRRFPCPRCGEPFSSKWGYRGRNVPQCVHCGLPKYAEP